MPTYDYECDACGHTFELFQSISEPVKKKCPDCGKPKLRRLFGTGAAVVFKGSGFYQTDYRSDSYKKAAEKDKPAEPKGDSKSETKSESKSDTKPSSESKPAAKTDKKKRSKSD
jgi:putative FmdB family regulatory protein